MKLHNLDGRSQTGYTTFGCIWSKGELKTASAFLVKTAAGLEVPVQSRVTAYYPDDSIKWTAHTADAVDLGNEIELIASDTPHVPSQGISVEKIKDVHRVHAGSVQVDIHESGAQLFSNFCVDGHVRMISATPQLKIERRSAVDGIERTEVSTFIGRISQMTMEEAGPLRHVFKFEGIHCNPVTGEELIPFIIRLTLGLGASDISLMHTFLYDGVEERDFLKGIGISVDSPATGPMYQRHIRFMGDAGSFHESSAQLLSWRPRIADHIYEKQCAGLSFDASEDEWNAVHTALKDMPFWDAYDFCQDSPRHFHIRKKTILKNVCWLDALDGAVARGGLSVGSDAGSLKFSIRDFAKRHPSGYTVSGLTTDTVATDIWFYSPSAEAFDFRHYTDRGYNQVYYEGYDFFGASAYGIAATSECGIGWADSLVAPEEELEAFCHQVDAPPLYVGDPEFYHEKKAFGYWSLPARDTEAKRYLEEQLDKAVDFYKAEVDQRNWTGLFNYGDFMHTYDKFRHVWRYDMGGYAWDNTELVPTLWLWLMFLRSGREDVFTLAEKLSRHASETDVYHFGKYKGMGSRHNVRHWGCPCKEARIAMAGHHRYFYYLTGDYRMEDIFAELKDNEMTFLEKDPMGEFYDKSKMVYPTHARSGPDWSSLCSNWMTQWERFNDVAYREKIMVGVRTIEKAPLQLVSGPDFEFNPETVELRYIGERATGGSHLQICMGAPSIWMEMGDLLDYENWKKMIADHGRFYFLPREQQVEESRGLIGEREFSLPFMASAMGAYGAWYLKDGETAQRVWKVLLSALMTDNDVTGFTTTLVPGAGNHKELVEIPWISTNFVAQWCLNIIMVLDFIDDSLPETVDGIKDLLSSYPQTGFRKA